jgi:hypothetical protein
MANETRLKAPVTASMIALVLAFGVACAPKPSTDGDGSFATAEEAAAALVDALAKDDTAAATRVLGGQSADLLSSGDPVQDATDRANFVAAYGKAHSLTASDAGVTTLVVGENDWPFPVPLVRRDDGRWMFDDEKGVEELVYRRIGRNELGAIAVCHGFVEAQREYAAVGHDGDDAGIYAMKLISDEGLENGLYWPTEDGEESSPAGPFVAAAAQEGYRRGEGPTPYHGYYYRMLYAQGPSANGGAREYFKDGLLTEGFALVAWPADYGVSGVMTFIVNADGIVFQKDLGEATQDSVEAMSVFDPDDSWTPVVDAHEG